MRQSVESFTVQRQKPSRFADWALRISYEWAISLPPESMGITNRWANEHKPWPPYLSFFIQSPTPPGGGVGVVAASSLLFVIHPPWSNWQNISPPSPSAKDWVVQALSPDLLAYTVHAELWGWGGAHRTVYISYIQGVKNARLNHTLYILSPSPTLHCNKRLPIFPSPAGMSQTRESLVSDISAGDGKIG